MVNENRNKTKEQLISEMTTPVLILWQDILCIPLTGTVDSKRAQQIMEMILNKILTTESKIIILDILGGQPSLWGVIVLSLVCPQR